MTPFVESFLGLIEVHGAWMLVVLTMAETCFVLGAVVESGLATALATILAGEGHFSFPAVAMAALTGGWLGDSLGFWIGRWGGAKLSEGKGRFARLFRRKRDEADRIFGRHPLVSVSFARLIPFVRSAMPMAAGMSRIITYRRYLAYEALGLAGWVSAYMSVGWIAGESWELASQLLGIGGAALIGLAVLAGWKLVRRRGAARRPREA